jgi:hypothetical protein
MDFRRSMIARLIAVGAVALVTGGAQVSCSSGDDSPLLPPIEEIDGDTGEGPTFTTRLVLRDSSGQETYRFARGELITFEVTVHNHTEQPVVLGYTGISGTAVVFTRSDDQPFWYPGYGTAYPAVMSYVTIEANETKTYSITWNQEKPDGSFLTRGNYRARGLFLAPGVLGPDSDYLFPHELASQLRGFTIN